MCVCVLPNKDSTSVGKVPENPAKTNGKKATFVPHLFQTLMRRMTTHILALDCYCITQTNRFWSQLARRAAPDSRFRPDLGKGGGPAAFVLGVFAYRLSAGCGGVFALMQRRKKKAEEEFVLGAIYRGVEPVTQQLLPRDP